MDTDSHYFLHVKLVLINYFVVLYLNQTAWDSLIGAGTYVTGVTSIVVVETSYGTVLGEAHMMRDWTRMCRFVHPYKKVCDWLAGT